LASAARTEPDPLRPETTRVAHSSAIAAPKPVANPQVVYRAGDPVPVPGTYWVWHSKHREAHASKVRFTVFPNCAHCGDKVRFHPAEERKGLLTEWLRRDPDFKQSLAGKRVRRRKTHKQ
jgi:hypothetical protein